MPRLARPTLLVPALAALLVGAPLPARAVAAPHASSPRVSSPRATVASPASPGGRRATDWRVPTASVSAPPAAVAAPALESGSARVRVVTARDVGGRPVIDATVVPAAQAVPAVDRAQDTPGTVAVAVDTAVTLADYDDPLRPQKWDLTQLGGETFHARADTSGVTVAVIDSGVDATHEDLQGVLVPGQTFLPGVPQSLAGGRGDPLGHGTHVAGIIAASADNERGAAGLAPGTRIMPVKVADAAGQAMPSDIAKGLVWAADHGAQVANLSLGGSDANAVEQSAVAYALGKGVVVVAAAGNDRQNGDAASYPAAFPGVLAVAATDRARNAAPFSNTGSYVGISAPGVGIISTYPKGLNGIGSGYAMMSGTSMASPFVAAAAAGLKALRPSLTPAQATGILESTATDLGPQGRDDTYGAGLVAPDVAVCALTTCPAVVHWTAPTWYPVTGTLLRASAQVTDALGKPLPHAPVFLCFAVGSGAPGCTPRVTDAAGRLDTSFTPRGTTTVTVRVGETSGAHAGTGSTTFHPTFAVRAVAGARSVSAVVSPRQTTVNLDRWDAGKRAWVYYRTAATTAAGAATFTKVPAGTYRIWVPGSALLAAGASGGVVVR